MKLDMIQTEISETMWRWGDYRITARTTDEELDEIHMAILQHADREGITLATEATLMDDLREIRATRGAPSDWRGYVMRVHDLDATSNYIRIQLGEAPAIVITHDSTMDDIYYAADEICAFADEDLVALDVGLAELTRDLRVEQAGLEPAYVVEVTPDVCPGCSETLELDASTAREADDESLAWIAEQGGEEVAE